MSENPAREDGVDSDEPRSFDPKYRSFDPPEHPSFRDAETTRAASATSTRRHRIGCRSATVRATGPRRVAAQR